MISLAPHVTELIYAAGGGAKLVGAVSYSDYPPEAKQLPRVGDNKALDLERIVALKPDLIVVWRHGNAQAQLERLRELHIPLFFSEPHQLDDVAVTLTRLGTLLGTSGTADAAASAYRQDIAQLRSALCEPAARQRVLSGLGSAADDAQRHAHDQRRDHAMRWTQRVCETRAAGADRFD